MRVGTDIGVVGNFSALMRNGGKIVPGSRREGHNIFTITGRNFLAKLVSWYAIGATDIPYTQRRVRWVGLGLGSQLESPSIVSLVQATLTTPTSYLRPIQTVEFPTSSTARFITEFSTYEITLSTVPVTVTEAGMFADVSPAQPGFGNDGAEDVPHDPGSVDTTLNPALATNPPIAYKNFEALTKTVDFTIEIRWDFRFE